MANSGIVTTTCPACRETVAAGASLCKNCGSNLDMARSRAPQHGGTCPYCKEQIQAEALVCKHCGSTVIGKVPGPTHNGTCPYCKEQIDPEAVVCKHCHSEVSGDLPAGLATARLINDGGSGYQESCVDRCYDICRRDTDHSSTDCWRRCSRVCRGRGAGAAFGDQVAAMAAAPEVVSGGCACGGATAGVEGDQATPVMARLGGSAGGLQPDGTIIYREKCHYETGQICTAQGCKPTRIRVCVRYPEFAPG